MKHSKHRKLSLSSQARPRGRPLAIDHRTMSNEAEADHSGGSPAPAGGVAAWDEETQQKINRVQNELLRTKSGSPVWEHFKVYVKRELNDRAVCMLCVQNESPQSAEVRCKDGSTTNLMSHLNTARQGHRAAHAAIKERNSGGGKGRVQGAAAGGQAPITEHFRKAALPWTDELVRLIVNNHLAFTVSAVKD